MISSIVVADSISDGVRLTTLQLSYPRFIHSEVMTHRVFSRNAASSRAIPIQKTIDQVLDSPAMPVWWGKNQPGMQAREELDEATREKALAVWTMARISACERAKQLMDLGVHKQLVNRLLEPWQEMKTIVTATEWDNFFALRRHPDAQPEIKALADAMWESMQNSTPVALKEGEWHLPYVSNINMLNDFHLLERAKKWSTARCARVSFLNHDNKEPDADKDEALHDKLLESGHFSPFEHQATPGNVWVGTHREIMHYANFKGWQSYRNQMGK